MVPGPAGGTVGFGVVGRGVGLVVGGFVVGDLVGRVVGRDVGGRLVVGRVDGVRVGLSDVPGVGVARALVGVGRGVAVALVGVTVGVPVESSPGAVGSEPLALSGSVVGLSVDTTSGLSWLADEVSLRLAIQVIPASTTTVAPIPTTGASQRRRGPEEGGTGRPDEGGMGRPDEGGTGRPDEGGMDE